MGANPTLSPSPLWGGKTARRSGWGAKGTSHSARTDPTLAPLRSAVPPHEGEGETRAILPSHPNSPGFFKGIQRPRRLRRRELALIEDGRRLSPGSVAREGRKALRACCDGSGWSGSSGSVCQGPLPREPSETGVVREPFGACGDKAASRQLAAFRGSAFASTPTFPPEASVAARL